MQRQFLLLVVIWLITSCGNTYYIVRHAEKATPSPGATMMTSNDPALSIEGEQRAKKLAELLKNRKITRIFTTNTLRTRSTVEPLADYLKLTPEVYTATDDDFITKLKALNKNALIVGHSNTVDDVVNKMTGEAHLADLPDSAYRNIFIIKRQGKRFRFQAATFEDLN